MGVFLDVLKWIDNKLYYSSNECAVFKLESNRLECVSEVSENQYFSFEIKKRYSKLFDNSKCGEFEDSIELKTKKTTTLIKLVRLFYVGLIDEDDYSSLMTSIRFIDSTFEKHLVMLRPVGKAGVLIIDARYLNLERDKFIFEKYNIIDYNGVYFEILRNSRNYVCHSDGKTYMMCGGLTVFPELIASSPLSDFKIDGFNIKNLQFEQDEFQCESFILRTNNDDEL